MPNEALSGSSSSCDKHDAHETYYLIQSTRPARHSIPFGVDRNSVTRNTEARSDELLVMRGHADVVTIGSLHRETFPIRAYQRSAVSGWIKAAPLVASKVKAFRLGRSAPFQVHAQETPLPILRIYIQITGA